MPITTDGAPGTAVDPGAGSTSWDAVLSDAVASTGVDPASSFPDDSQDSAAPAPQTPASESSAGTTPSGSPAAPQVATPGDDGQGPPADPAVPDTTQIEGATPFTYTGADGEAKTIDGAFVLPGDGLYVPEARIPHFQLLASRAESVERQNRELYDQTKSLERLTEWTQTGADGKQMVLTGREAVEASKVAYGHSLAENRMYKDLFTDPMKLAAMLVHVGDGVFQFDPERKQLLDERIGNLQYRVENSVRQRMGEMASAPPPPVPSLSAAEIAERALPTVDAVITSAKLSGLTTEDKQALARLIPRYTVTVTPQNAAQYPQSRLGETALDYQAFLPEAQDRAKLRAATIAATKTTATVDKFNGGMQQGRTAPKTPPKKSDAPAPKPAKVGKAQAWDTVFQEAMADVVV